jgi:hypothetical protein
MNSADWARHSAFLFGTLVQTIFIILYATRPWRYSGPTVSLMVSNFALWLFLSLTSVRTLEQYVSDNPPWDKNAVIVSSWDIVNSILYWFVVLAMLGQLASLIYEMRKTYNERHHSRSS